MLSYLHIRDLVLINHLELEFGPGMAVLTGETGAGKSILIDALGLVLGDRAEPRMVRRQSSRAEISAEFGIEANPAARQWLADQGIDDDTTCLIRRTIPRTGRSRAFVNGTPVTQQALKSLGETLVDIHGQHEHQSLLRPEIQRQLLDGWGRHGELVNDTAAAYRYWRERADQLDTLSQGMASLRERHELLTFQVEDLGELDPQPGEEQQLAEELQRLAHADALLEGMRRTGEQLYDADEGTLHSELARAARDLAELGAIDADLLPLTAILDDASIQIQEVASTLRRAAERVERDPARQQEVESRMGLLHTAARKYRVPVEALPDLFARLRDELEAIADPGTTETRLHEETAAAEARYRELAARLGALRTKAATSLAKQVTQAMHDLGMPGGRFAIELEEHRVSQHGNERIRFVVSANPGQDLLPLQQAASGGELSRISLAIQSVSATSIGVPTLVFDEVDVGIGGRVAEIVGRLLRELGRQRQVLCITHLPQVAALGIQHLQVSKRSDGGETKTQVEILDAPTRIDEIARMLGGVKITAQTRAHAEEMIRLAAGD